MLSCLFYWQDNFNQSSQQLFGGFFKSTHLTDLQPRSSFTYFSHTSWAWKFLLCYILFVLPIPLKHLLQEISMYRRCSSHIRVISLTACHSDLWVIQGWMLNSLCSAMCLFNKVLPLDSTLVSGTRELWLCLGVKLPQSINLAEVYFIRKRLPVIIFNRNLFRTRVHSNK